MRIYEVDTGIGIGPAHRENFVKLDDLKTLLDEAETHFDAESRASEVLAQFREELGI